MFWSKKKKKSKAGVYYIKVGCKRLFITRTCYHDEIFGLGHQIIYTINIVGNKGGETANKKAA